MTDTDQSGARTADRIGADPGPAQGDPVPDPDLHDLRTSPNAWSRSNSFGSFGGAGSADGAHDSSAGSSVGVESARLRIENSVLKAELAALRTAHQGDDHFADDETKVHDLETAVEQRVRYENFVS